MTIVESVGLNCIEEGSSWRRSFTFDWRGSIQLSVNNRSDNCDLECPKKEIFKQIEIEISLFQTPDDLYILLYRIISVKLGSFLCRVINYIYTSTSHPACSNTPVKSQDTKLSDQLMINLLSKRRQEKEDLITLKLLLKLELMLLR